jgi:Spy/CpxP family protein refolding chaperone
MKRTYIAVGMLLLLIGGGALVFAQARRAHYGMGMGCGLWHGRGEQAFIDHFSRTFDLTDAQKADVQQMWAAEKPVIMPIVQQLASTHKQMVAASANGKFDDAAVTSLASKQGQAIAQLIVEKQRMTAKFYTLLTPEQRAKFDRIQQSRLSRMDQFIQKLGSNQAQ